MIWLLLPLFLGCSLICIFTWCTGVVDGWLDDPPSATKPDAAAPPVETLVRPAEASSAN